mmetsp:Transcript_26255/g.54129  ORF Transcript_26255/g.54129 Transcript_26255/m.54129 type:complete len:99 (+) Transcript_26255:30-326(+)
MLQICSPHEIEILHHLTVASFQQMNCCLVKLLTHHGNRTNRIVGTKYASFTMGDCLCLVSPIGDRNDVSVKHNYANPLFCDGMDVYGAADFGVDTKNT